MLIRRLSAVQNKETKAAANQTASLEIQQPLVGSALNSCRLTCEQNTTLPPMKQPHQKKKKAAEPERRGEDGGLAWRQESHAV